MKSIGLISDTHGFVHPKLKEFFKDVDEVWHAGDIGDYQIIANLASNKPFRAVYGNIDDTTIRKEYPEHLSFTIEKVKVVILHIGGYPGKYSSFGKDLIKRESPDLFISGHSHILKAIYDKKNKLLHLNPGAAGRNGFHQYITFMRFVVDNGNIRDLEVANHPRSSLS
ncbi:MAG: metallophosphatase family protein [Bacteroidales bacterium]|nr:metallophosphatase family protein [Bacteroidales bacterium]